MPLQIAPLPEKEELSETVPGSGFGQGAARIVHGRRFAAPDRLRPFQPARSAVSLFQCHEQAKVFEPGCLFSGEFLQRRLEGAVSLRLEIFPRACQKLLLPFDDPPENDAIVPKGPGREIVRPQQAVFHK